MYSDDQWIMVKQNHWQIANIHESHENPGGGKGALQQIYDAMLQASGNTNLN